MYLLNDINSTTLFDYSYTYHYSKYSCSTAFYFIHVVFCYIVFLSGLGSFITRLHPKIKPAHQWFGRTYILSMSYATASSLLIHNTGLPLAVLYSFAICIGGLTVAWILILLHKNWLNTLVFKNIYEKLYLNGFMIPIPEYIDYEKGLILEDRTFCQRLFSYKTFHGALMFMSWINITGRIFASDQSGDFQCYTYPIYKIGNDTMELAMDQSNIEFDIVPEIDPNYNRLPWANIENWWAVIFSIGPFLLAFAFSALWSGIEIIKIRSGEMIHI